MTDLEVLTLNKLQCPSTLASGPVFHGWSQVLPSLGSFLINSATSPITFFVTKFISAAFWVHTLSLSAWLFSDSFIRIRHVSLQIDYKLRSRNPVTFFVERAHNIEHGTKHILSKYCEVTDTQWWLQWWQLACFSSTYWDKTVWSGLQAPAPRPDVDVGSATC